jgi:hypothetical protein
LALDATAGEVPEARYRLGKCLLKTKKVQSAREEFEKLIQAKDEFWSPLARNELKLIPGVVP